ncbi:MAG TPA: electron transport complex subunit RsxE [Gammaproteobacteria bacterium]|nr:electron transport complex subunit RsxE [Gammaproteobacteria bacterium]
MNAYTKIIKNGLWDNNPGLVQLLGLCPLLAVSGTVINGLGMGLATLATLLVSNVLVSLVRDYVKSDVRIPVFVLIIASTVTAIELLMNAWFYDLYKVLGIFVPLIVTNCLIIGRAEAFAAKNKVMDAVIDALAMGIGFTLVLVCIGGMRELVGEGTLFANAHLMFGETARSMELSLGNQYQGFLLAVLPPGAFISLGLLIALKNIIDDRIKRKQSLPVSNDALAAGPTS